MPDLADLVNDLIALIPEDGSRITNDEIRTALEREAGEPISDEELKELKSQVVALGAAEGVKGPGGGLRAAGIDTPPRAAAPAAGSRSRRNGNGTTPSTPSSTIAPGTTAASVLTGALRNQIDRIWDAFWSGGIANPLEVLEQLTYLLFIRRLDELETLEERRSQRSGQPMRRRIFPEGADEQGRPWSELRWSRFKELGEAASMFKVVGERVFPFLRELGGEESAYATHMRDARFTIPTPGLLTKVVELLDAVPMEDRDTKGDIYEYMLGKLATAGTNGQFRTPRHIIELMVAMTEPTPRDVMVDPACGTCGFPVAVGEYLREHHPEILSDPELREHFNHGLFHGFDFALRGRRHRGEQVHLNSGQSALRRIAGLREHQRQAAAGGEDEEDRAAVHGVVPAAAQARRPGGRDRARWRAVRLLQRPQRTPPHPGGRPFSGGRGVASERGVPPLCRHEHRDSVFHQNWSGRHRIRLVL